MDIMSKIIKQQIDMQRVQEDLLINTATEWIWKESDPLAVHLGIADGDEMTEWVFGYDLLIEGLQHDIAYGEGDVRVFVDVDFAWIVLIGKDGGLATLKTPVHKLRKFVMSVPAVEFEISDEDIFNFIDHGGSQ